ncbi:hypothetical protein C8R45DRAFT_1104158 [Mycena sanguinolenta]|nr:hypothetical protein C8R45DRAFT_1104158 [Mycena sanguinolenta]
MTTTVQPRRLPPPPQTQARSSCSFGPPTLDGSLTIAQVYDWHFRNTPNHRVFIYIRTDGSIRTIYWPEAVPAVYVGARILRNRFNWVPGRADAAVLAILASSGACLRTNYIVFPISPRNSPSAIAHLVNNTGVEHLLIGHEPAVLELATAALSILKNDSSHGSCPDISYIPLFEDLFLPAAERTILPEDLPHEYNGPDAPACVIHSSGSTSFPKPIYWSNRRITQAALMPWFGDRDLTGQIVALHSMPMYHSMGLLQTWWSATCGMVIGAFEPQAIPIIANTSSFTDPFVDSFQAWPREPEYIRGLATRSGLLYGGGSLNKEVGDYMTSQGVTLFLVTEAGVLSLILPGPDVGYDWEYFSFPEAITPEMVPNGNNTFELVMVSEGSSRLRRPTSIPHPTKPGYWKILGRTDDQLMHNTGEKTNPGPLEKLLNQDPHVRSSVMFGRGRYQVGVIVDPKPPSASDPTDSVKLAEFRNKIWPTVKKMNCSSPRNTLYG